LVKAIASMLPKPYVICESLEMTFTDDRADLIGVRREFDFFIIDQAYISGTDVNPDYILIVGETKRLGVKTDGRDQAEDAFIAFPSCEHVFATNFKNILYHATRSSKENIKIKDAETLELTVRKIAIHIRKAVIEHIKRAETLKNLIIEPEITKNFLYYGDNLDVLRKYIKSNSIKAIYIDPPFNAKKKFNIIFKGKDGKYSIAQIYAFNDTWNYKSQEAIYNEIIEKNIGGLAEEMQHLKNVLGESGMLAYLVFMAIRLVELHRVLRDDGTMYLHCDYHADYHLRAICDIIFGRAIECPVTWKRHSGNHSSKTYGKNTDTILMYTKSDTFTFNKQLGKPDKLFPSKEEETGRFYMLEPLWKRGNAPKSLIFPSRGKVTAPEGKRFIWGQEKLDEELAKNPLVVLWSKNNIPSYKMYEDEYKGKPLNSLWDDISGITTFRNPESRGYDTQKPLELVCRAFAASSNPGETILDAFAGGGTSMEAAQKLGRKWIGIDNTLVAINAIKERLKDVEEKERKNGIPVEEMHFTGVTSDENLEIIGVPSTLEKVLDLASENPREFKMWVLGTIGAIPIEDARNPDVDGYIPCKDIILYVKLYARKTTEGDVRDFYLALKRLKSGMGVIITMDEIDISVKKACDIGFFKPSDLTGYIKGTRYPRMQAISINDLLHGKKIKIPYR